METEYYLSHSNGDFNIKANDIGGLLDNVSFEIETGGASFLIITKKPLRSEKYGEI